MLLFSYEGHNVIPKHLSHFCDNEIRQSKENESNVWKQAKSVGEKKEKGASLTFSSHVIPRGTPTTYLPSHTPKLSATGHPQIWQYKKHMYQNWRRRAENYWRCFLQRGETRMNQITAKMRHLQCDAVSKATVMFPPWFFAFFVIFCILLFHWNTKPLVGGGRPDPDGAKKHLNKKWSFGSQIPIFNVSLGVPKNEPPLGRVGP